MLSPQQGIQMDRSAILYALGSIAAFAVVLKKTIFRGSKANPSAPAAQKSSVKDILAGSGPDAEPKQPAEDAPTEDVALPPAADAISIHEHPAVKKAEKRMHKSRLLRKMDEDVKELMRQVVYLRAIAQA